MKEKTDPSNHSALLRTAGDSVPGRKWKVFSLAGFIVINLALPIGGLFFLDWNLYEMAVLYWTENLIIGVLMVLQILNADAGSLDDDMKLFGAIPSLVIYFPLCLGQAVLIQFCFKKHALIFRLRAGLSAYMRLKICCTWHLFR